jgi:predicted SprT family Zn-dependent metalloprotease
MIVIEADYPRPANHAKPITAHLYCHFCEQLTLMDFVRRLGTKELGEEREWECRNCKNRIGVPICEGWRP